MTVVQVLNKSKFYSLISQTMTISYVMHSYQDFKKEREIPKLAWVVYMRGLPPIITHDDPAINYTNTYMRTVIDDLTGDSFGSVNIPQAFLKIDE